MRRLTQALAGLAIVFLAQAGAQAQSTSGGPGSGPGTTSTNPGTPTGGGAAAPLADVDLPIDAPPKPAPPAPPNTPPNTPPPPPVVPPPDDPPTQNDDKPPTIYGTPIKSENHTIFYVLDASGSMGWDVAQFTSPDGSTKSGNRLDRAKAELAKSVMSLPDNFKFNMLAYDCGVYPWGSAMVPADTAHKAKAVGWIYSQQPMGATGTGPATALGLQAKGNKLVVLLTDGDPNCGIGGSGDFYDDSQDAHRQLIKSSNKQGAVVNVFGIGATGSFKKFCQNVASDNGGSYTDVR